MSPTPHLALADGDQATSFGALLRCWREHRRRSQLELALDAGVSQRHLSFLESGRSRPSREMVLQLSDTLAIPLRARNLLLHAAGFASMFPERGMQHDEMKPVLDALQQLLRHHEPYPAVVVNRQWDMLMCNPPAERFVALMGPAEEVWQRVDPSGRRNVMRMSFHPQGMRPLLKNWPQVAALLLKRLQHEVEADPGHGGLRQLLADMTELAGHGVTSSLSGAGEGLQPLPPPLFQLEYQAGGAVIKVFSMMSTFGTALDVTADELRVETFFPVDEPARAFFAALASTC